MDGKGGCTSLGIGTRGGKSARYGTWNVVKGRDVPFVLKANDPPDDAFKTLIKRTPSARPHDAETGRILVHCCLAARRRGPQSPSQGVPNTSVAQRASPASLQALSACVPVCFLQREQQRAAGSAESVVPRHKRCGWRQGGRGRFFLLLTPEQSRPCVSSKIKIVPSWP